MTYRFTFLRHAESIGNRDGYIQGQHDYPLSPKGIDQTRKLTHKWLDQGFNFDLIISSTLTRAISTAEIIQSQIDAPIRTDPIWMERNMGKHQGVLREDFYQRPPRPFFQRMYDSPGETGESEWQLYLRAGNALQSLFKNPPGDYLIVSHGGLLNKVLYSIFGIKPHPNFPGLHFALTNTAYTRIEYNSDRNQWRMLDFIQPETLPSHHTSSNSSYQLTFVRHAESQGNIDKVFQGQTETPLTRLGEAQASALGEHFVKIKKRFDRVYSSPQIRALQTAELVCTSLNLKIETSPLLKEINNGKLAGLNGDEISSRFSTRPDQSNPYLPVGENGESWLELFLRGMKVIDLIFSNPPGDFLVISHGTILNAILLSIIGTPPQPSMRSAFFHFENTGYCRLSIIPEENLWRFLSLNPAILLPKTGKKGTT
jgi:2,3-bisphosphoglycerate-dependent phosphoglycerate mutase